MPNIKSAKKRVKVTKTKTERNKAYKSALRTFIKNALSPAKNAIVNITNETKKEALAVVASDQLSVAIGKGGNNIKLASRLTKYKINIKTMEEINAEGNK